jgi:hypothetical protein
MKEKGVEMRKSMKAEDIVLLLREVEILMNQGKSIKISCREAGVSEFSYRKWRQEYGGLQVSQVKELKRFLNEALSGKQ